MILVLEDTDVIREVLVQTLQNAGYSVVYATSEEEVRLLLDGRQPVTLAILDLRLDETWDGLAMISLLRLASRQLPIIAMSGAGDEALDMAQQAGASVSIAKPFSPDTLLKLVAGFLGALPGAAGIA